MTIQERLDKLEEEIKTIEGDCDETWWACSESCPNGCGLVGVCADCLARIASLRENFS